MGDSNASGNSHSESFDRLCQIVARLRAPGGCPWDREQTNESILPQLIEEAYELVGAVQANDTANFREELGDVLLHVVMHAEIARENGLFTIDDVLNEVSDKLVRRHPHVFGNSAASDTGAVLKQWEAIKREEKGDSHYLASLPDALPALVRAQKAQKKVARVNFDWEKIEDVIGKVEEEVTETKTAIAQDRAGAETGPSRKSDADHEVEDEIGDLLFAVVNLARKCGIDAESALQKSTDKFRRRFHRLEDELRRQGKPLGEAGLAELDATWNKIKRDAGC
ncbi:MAG: nucleoside triphosphate diphosphatase [Verrucomicrobiota bacterium]|jgi:XTP/dITP diphosphohydrolase/tetrapyrrole methylase family protein/MazG family protein